MHAHQPGEELADFTENEILSLIDAGTAGAYSEIYRRYHDDAESKASASLLPAQARQVTDEAFLSVLRSLLNGSADTAEGLRALVESTVDEHLASATSPHGSEPYGDDSPGDAGAPEAALVAQALSTLPDNWQRILWMCEVERLSPGAVAERLNIRTSTIDRLAGRARQGLKDEWQQVRPTKSAAIADNRSALISALLTSPIVIERLSDTLAQSTPEPTPTGADAPVVETAAAGTSTAEAADADTSALEQPEAETAADGPAATSFVLAPGADPGTTSGPAPASGTEADAEAAAAAAAGAEADIAADTTAAAGVSAGTMGASAATTEISARTAASAGFHMPKPVLIPVVAACIGLLGTLVGVAIVPQHSAQTGFRPGSASTEASPSDSSSEKGDNSSTSHSPDDTNSGEPGQRPGSEKSEASDSGRDGNEKSPRSPGHNDDRSDKESSTAENPGDDSDNSSRDSPSAGEPGDPGPSDSDKSDPKSPAEPTPSTPDDPETPSEPSPSQPDDPAPTGPPATDPPPSDEPTEPPPEEPSPSDPPPDTEPPPDTGPPAETGAPSESGPTQDGS